MRARIKARAPSRSTQKLRTVAEHLNEVTDHLAQLTALPVDVAENGGALLQRQRAPG